MTQSKLLFDECIGRPHIESLKTFVAIDGSDAPEIKHILEFQAVGTWDEEWIPQIAEEGWIIISQDLGRGGRAKGSPLPELCMAYKITHVLLSPLINTRKSFDKMLTILSVWRELLALADRPKGSRFQIEPHGVVRDDNTKGKLVEKVVSPHPRPDGRLFDPEK